MRRSIALLFLCTISLVAQSESAPVNPHASPEARALLHYLYSMSGKYTLTGQHNYPNVGARWTDRALDLTGKLPAVFGQDFGFSGGEDKDSILGRPDMIAEAIRQYRNGAVVTLTWHALRPVDDEPVTFRDSVQGHLTDFEWRELLTPGTTLNRRWCAQVDVIAGYLKQLQAAHVPVLWRPYHEVNGGWFWWGGRKGKDGSAALYRQLFDRFVNYHHLDNLIWVWNANAPGSGGGGPGPYADYFPGIDVADVASVDIYGEFQQSFYDDLLKLAAGKPVALGEVGSIPSPEVLGKQPKYAWFMSWSEWVQDANSLDALRAVYDSAQTASRNDPRVAEAMAAIHKASAASEPVPVTPKPSDKAKALLAALYAAPGNGVLSGQEGDAAPVVTATGKSPSIHAAELSAAAVEDAKHHHALVSLTWKPVSPTGAKVTDFEWNELITPGTDLYQRWVAQVDEAAALLKQLDDAGVGVLWRPYPQPNGEKSWWSGRKGIRGSSELYRMLFERLADHHKLRNLVWVWEAVPASFGPKGPSFLDDYFPGLLYVDAIQLDLRSRGWREDQETARFAVGKPIGLGLEGWVPDPAVFEDSRWAWFLATPETATNTEALRKLYASPVVK